jgi:hypothetical protein
MQILQHVRTQQHRFLALGIAFFHAPRALLGQFVEPWVETFARFGNKRPAELFEPKLKIPSVTNLLLEPGNFPVVTAVSRLWRQHQGDPIIENWDRCRGLVRLVLVLWLCGQDEQTGDSEQQSDDRNQNCSTALACALVDCLLASFHFFAFGKHYAGVQRLDALAAQKFLNGAKIPS